MIINTMNVADIQSALGLQLAQWPAIIDMAELEIQHNEEIPDSETRCPWVGIYCISHEMPIRTLGMGAGMRYQKIMFWAVCKEASPNSGNECAAKLEGLIQMIGSAILSDCSLRGTVDIVQDLKVTYPEWGKKADVYVQTAVIQFTVQTTVQAGG